MTRQLKSIRTAYILWFLIGLLGAHRMYLGRSLSGLFVALVNALGAFMVLIGVLQENSEYVMVGGTCLLAGAVWCLLDAFFIPGMVRSINERDQTKSFVSLGAVNFDPSFTATLERVGRSAQDGTGRTAIPEGYEMPWRKERAPSEVVKYRNPDLSSDGDDA